MAAELRGRAGTAVPDTAASYPLPLNHFNRNAHAQHRVVLEKGGRAGTAVPDAAASYTQQRGPDPLTKANDSRIERESGHGCARRRCIIYSNERGGGVGSGHGCARYRGIIHSTPDPLQP